jgi:hypothetical protein
MTIRMAIDLDGPNAIWWRRTTRHFTIQSAYKLQRGYYQPFEGE